MAGFTAIICKNEFIPENIKFSEKNKYGHKNDFITNAISADKFKIEQYTNQKFLNDKTFLEDEQLIIGMEGVILNLKYLAELTGKSKVFEIVKEIYLSNKDNFMSLLKGEFAGFIYSKVDDSWLIFTNQTGSKRLFYFENLDYFIFASELRDISYLLHQLKIPVKLDLRAD